MATTITARETSTASPSRNIKQRKIHHEEKDPFLNIKEVVIPQEPIENGTESFWSKFIFGPITFLSYIFSLTLISRHYNTRRAREHNHSVEDHPVWNRLSTWWDPEPYQNTATGTWHTESPAPIHDNRSASWVINKKHRAVTKMEMNDAWQLRPLVLLGILAVFVLAVGGFVWILCAMWAQWM